MGSCCPLFLGVGKGGWGFLWAIYPSRLEQERGLGGGSGECGRSLSPEAEGLAISELQFVDLLFVVFLGGGESQTKP